MLRWLVTAALTFAGVCLVFLLGEGHGFLPWILVFLVGLAIGFRSGGPWLAGVVGVIAAQVVVEVIQESFKTGSVRTVASFAGDGLLLAIVVFTPAYLFGAAWRRGPGLPAEPERMDPAAPGSPSDGWLSSGQMIFVGCATLAVFGLLMVYIGWQWIRGGGY